MLYKYYEFYADEAMSSRQSNDCASNPTSLDLIKVFAAKTPSRTKIQMKAKSRLESILAMESNYA